MDIPAAIFIGCFLVALCVGICVHEFNAPPEGWGWRKDKQGS